MKLYLNLLLVFVLSFNAFAANIGDDKVNVGNPANTSTDKEIIFNDGSASASRKKISIDGTTKNLKSNSNNLELGDDVATGDKSIVIKRGGSNPVIKWNETLDRLEFSNDGTIYKAVGSGGGGGTGGVNLLNNDSFEDGIVLGWTSSGGTFSSQNYTNTEPNNLKFARFIASASGQFFESSVYVIPDEVVGGCLAYIRYKTSTNNAFKLSFFSAGVEINSQTLPTTNGEWNNSPAVPVLCPTAGTSVKARVESLAAATIDADKAYLGTDNRIVRSSSPRYVGNVSYPVTASCAQIRTTAGQGSFPNDTDCGAPSISYVNQGGVVISNADQDSFGKVTFTNLPKGILEVRLIQGSGDASTVNATEYIAFTDGATTSEEFIHFAGATGRWAPRGSFRKAYPNGATNLTIEVLGRYGAGSSITLLGSDGGFSYDVYLWPLDTDTAITSDQSSWFIDANIGGANPSLGATSITSYTEISNASLDLVLRSGSAPAQIGCSGTNPPTGTTCSAGNESVALAWTPPFTGYFDVCFDFSHNFDLASTAVADAVFQVVETGTNNQTILAEGGSRVESRGNITSANNLTFPHKVCGSFLVSSVSQKVHRLMYELSASGTVNTNVLNADRSASLGQRDIRVTIRPSTMNVARPVLVGDIFKRAVITGDSTNALSAGTYTTRDLSVEQSDEFNIVTLSSDQFTLAAGTYHLSVDYSVHRVDTYNSVITNVSDSSTACTGIQGYASNASATGAQASYSCIITISAPKNFALQFNPSSAASANYYGSQITIDKLK